MASRTEGRRAGVLAALTLLALAIAVPTEASVLRGLTLRELRLGADVIVSGEVVAVRSVRTERSIDTVVRVRVQQSYRGKVGKSVLVRVPGGEHGGLHLVVPGSPRFQRGGRVLMFLSRDGEEYRPVGLFQGVWTIDPAAPDRAIAGNPGGASVLPSADGVLAVAPGERTLRELVGGGR